MTPAPMSYAFSLTRDDLAALAGPRGLALLSFDLKWYLAAAATVGVAFGVAEDVFDARPLPAWLAATLLAGVFLGGGAAWRRWRRDRAVAGWPLPQRTRVEVAHDHLALVEDGTERFVAWELVRAVHVDAARVILWLDPPQASVVLPLRAFEGAADMRAFAAFAQDRLRDAEEADDAACAAPAGSLSVETVVTAEDLRGLRARGTDRPLSYTAALCLAALIGAALLGGVGQLLASALGLPGGGSSLWLWGALAGAGAGATAVGVWLDRAQARLQRETTPVAARLTIDADGLTRASDGAVARVAWRRVARIESGADALAFWLGPEAILAPRRCFAAQADFDAFAAAARAWRRAALFAPAEERPTA